MLAVVVMEIFPLMYQRVNSFVFIGCYLGDCGAGGCRATYCSDCAGVLPALPTRIRILMAPGSYSMAGTMPYQLMYLFILVRFLYLRMSAGGA